MTSLHQLSWHHNIQRNVLLEYARLKQTCPAGIYLTLKPGALTQWSGVLFVRKGPYAPAVLRFQISFPLEYPNLAPVITFISDIFHPLVAPLTTYTYTTRTPSLGSVSASNEERLGPGGFSLRHGFPHWFSRSQKSAQSSATGSRNASDVYPDFSNQSEYFYKPPPPEDQSSRESSQRSGSFRTSNVQTRPWHSIQPKRQTNITEVLEYLKRAFDDETLLDALPLEAAGNLCAWKGWRAYRRNCETDNEHVGLAPDLQKQDEWSWDGVWEERVRKGIDASIAESTLYGGTSGAGELIRFVDVGPDLVEGVRADVASHVAGS